MIGAYAFFGCSGLSSVTIPPEVDSISYATFEGCSSLTFVSIQGYVNRIDYYAFAACVKLTELKIPADVLENSMSDLSDGFEGSLGIQFDRSGDRCVIVWPSNQRYFPTKTLRHVKYKGTLECGLKYRV